jgi:hypothetical protein
VLNHVRIECLLRCAVKLNVVHFGRQVIIITRELIEVYLLHLFVAAIVDPSSIDQVSRLALMISRHLVRVV